MPVALQRACQSYGCSQPAETCVEHGRKAQAQAYDIRRGSSSSRGYGARWRHYVVAYRNELSRHGIAPLCGARLPNAPSTQDSRCQRDGKVTLGYVVDHIVPVSGPHDPRFYDPSNHQLLCDGRGYGCHDAKRQREARR